MIINLFLIYKVIPSLFDDVILRVLYIYIASRNLSQGSAAANVGDDNIIQSGNVDDVDDMDESEEEEYEFASD